MPIGTIILFAGLTIPYGWTEILCPLAFENQRTELYKADKIKPICIIKYKE